jgi:hypothetical protein
MKPRHLTYIANFGRAVFAGRADKK